MFQSDTFFSWTRADDRRRCAPHNRMHDFKVFKVYASVTQCDTRAALGSHKKNWAAEKCRSVRRKQGTARVTALPERYARRNCCIGLTFQTRDSYPDSKGPAFRPMLQLSSNTFQLTLATIRSIIDAPNHSCVRHNWHEC